LGHDANSILSDVHGMTLKISGVNWETPSIMVEPYGIKL
jgi:hypothetical protein